MQTQQATGMLNYTDREWLAEHRHTCEAWYFIYPDAIHRLLADVNGKVIGSLGILPAPNLFSKSLSELKHLLQQFSGDGLEVQQTHAVLVDHRYTFVPEPLFDSAKASDHLKLIHGMSKLHGAYHEKNGDRVTVYGMNDLFYNGLRLALPGVVFHHYAGLLVKAFGELHDKKDKERLYVNLSSTGMDVFHFGHNQLQFANHFPYEADTDVIYFLLSVAEMLKLNPEKWEVVLCGDITAENSLISLMKKYIPLVLLFRRPGEIKYPTSFREFQEQQHVIELTPLLCGL